MWCMRETLDDISSGVHNLRRTKDAIAGAINKCLNPSRTERPGNGKR